MKLFHDTATTISLDIKEEVSGMREQIEISFETEMRIEAVHGS